MSDDEFVSGDAGAAGTTPIRVGELKKGSLVMIKGHACKIVDYSTAKTGKHGSAKAMYVGIDVFTGSKHEDTAPTGANTAAPVLTRSEWLLTDINDDDANDEGSIASLLNPDTGDTRDDLRVPDTDEYKLMREALTADQKDLFVIVIEAIGKAKIMPEVSQKDRK